MISHRSDQQDLLGEDPPPRRMSYRGSALAVAVVLATAVGGHFVTLHTETQRAEARGYAHGVAAGAAEAAPPGCDLAGVSALAGSTDLGMDTSLLAGDGCTPQDIEAWNKLQPQLGAMIDDVLANCAANPAACEGRCSRVQPATGRCTEHERTYEEAARTPKAKASRSSQ